MRTTTTLIALLSPLVLTSCATSNTPKVRQPLPTDLEQKTRAEQEFTAFDPHYKEEKAARIASARTFYATVREREASGQSTTCSKEILWELKALLTQTANFTLVDQRLADLESSLNHPELEAGADQQNPARWHLGSLLRRMVLQTRRVLDELGKESNKDRPLNVLHTSSTA